MEQRTTKCQYPDWEGGIVLSEHAFGKDGFCSVCGELQDVDRPIMNSEEPKTDFQKWGEAMSELKEALLEYHPFFILARRLWDILAHFFPNEASESLQRQASAQQAVSEMLNEDGYADTLHLGC